MKPSRNSHPKFPKAQRGAIFLVMIVVLTVGILATLIGALSKVGLQTVRNEKSSDMLAQAKEVVIGYALNNTGGSQYPGALLYPDVLSEATPNYNGNSAGGCLDATQVSSSPIPGLPLKSSTSVMRCLGRLPWKAFSMPIPAPSEHDSTGFMPWYAISANMVDTGGIPFNSELLNTDNTLHAPNNYPAPPHPWLTVRDMNGNVVSDRVAFVIIIPNGPVNGQARPASPNLGGADQYLDSITVGGITYSNADMDDSFIMGDEHRWIDDPANPGKQIEDSTYNFNDKLIYVTIDELMPLIEKRIAREVKNCLDTYAASSGNKYPWAEPIAGGGYISGTLFGRIPSAPTINTPYSPTDPWIIDMLDHLAALQTALDAYAANDNATTRNALYNVGDNLKDVADDIVDKTSPPYPANIIDIATPAKSAGNRAKDLAYPPSSYSISNVQSRIDAANAALANMPGTAEDPSMQTSWPSGCFASGTYWDEWKSLVLYQVAGTVGTPNRGFIPNGDASCASTTCLNVSGSGNPNSGSGSYRAAITMAGKKLDVQTRVAQTVDQYLESNNQTAQTNRSYDTYKPADADYSNVNDLVLCLDGKNNCK